jgi:dTMP kinase
MDLQALRDLIAIATGGLQPHLTVYLDVPVELGLERKHAAHGQGEEINHLDLQSVEFHRRVVAGYRELIAAEPARWRVVDATASSEAVQSALRDLISSFVE